MGLEFVPIELWPNVISIIVGILFSIFYLIIEYKTTSKKDINVQYVHYITGFDYKTCSKVLLMCNNNVEKAIIHILNYKTNEQVISVFKQSLKDWLKDPKNIKKQMNLAYNYDKRKKYSFNAS